MIPSGIQSSDTRPAHQVLEVTSLDGKTVLAVFQMHASNLCAQSDGRYNRKILGIEADRMISMPMHVSVGPDTSAVIELSQSDIGKLKAYSASNASTIVEARVYSAKIAGMSAIRQAQLGGAERKVKLRLSGIMGPSA